MPLDSEPLNRLVACPALLPGDPNERRFFYTSADHLRNSFSHIPSHMAECSACPDEVKAKLEEYKSTRNSQKGQLKQGSHKIFIDRVWERLHGPSYTDDEDSDDEDDKSHAKKAAPSALVQASDRMSTSDLTYFTLLNVAPYLTAGGQDKSSEEDDEDSREIIGFPGVVCRHCMNRKFFTTSSEHLGDLLVTISDHLAICTSGLSKEEAIARGTAICDYKSTHETQLKQLAEGEHDACMQRIWDRLVILNKGQDLPVSRPTPVRYREVDSNVCLVTPAEESLVTPFTYHCMLQVRACNLDNSGNGSRSTFDSGFPGLECIHCAGQPNARRFFYRTADILGGKRPQQLSFSAFSSSFRLTQST